MKNFCRDSEAKLISTGILQHKVKFKEISSIDLIVGLYMPTQKGTKVSFLRAIFCNKKKALKQTNVSSIVVPHYDELSVKNLYADAMKDELVKNYLPDLE